MKFTKQIINTIEYIIKEKIRSIKWWIKTKKRKRRLDKSFDRLEEVMIWNIGNSLFQIKFHGEATPKKLKNYYGWDKEFKEKERAGMVNDTKARLKQEVEILKFLVGNKEELKKEHAKKDPFRDIN